MPEPRADWQLPAGVPRSLWDYTQSESIAAEYGAACARDSLCQADEAVVLEKLVPFIQARKAAGSDGSSYRVGDFGCGSGRHSVALARAGAKVLAVDLSQPMLRETAAAARAENLDVQTVRANLVELDCIADGCLDAAVCMFSTFGMIRGRKNRTTALRHLHRTLKPNGRLLLHVHNVGSLAFSAFAFRWLPGQLWNAALGRAEFGDTVSDFHGVPNFFLHFFSAGELRSTFAAADLRILDWVRLSHAPVRRLPTRSWGFPGAASGWIVEAVPADS